jgi:hypothetical protein
LPPCCFSEVSSITRTFELFHVNGIEKVCSSSGAEDAARAPRVTRLTVAVPPKWTPHHSATVQEDTEASLSAQLVDVVRTRWQRARCHWTGEAPSLV